MTPHETGSTATPGTPRATAPPPRTFGRQGPTLGDLIDAYLQDYQVRHPRLCDPESDDRPRPTRVISPRPMRILSVGLVRTRHDSCNNAAARRWLLTDPMARSHPWPRDR